MVQKGKLDKPVTFWNRTYQVASDWAAEVGPGANAIQNLSEAIYNADIVWSCLATQDAVLSCFDKMLETSIRGKLFVESSTVTPEATNRLAERVREAGAEFISMPGMEFSFDICFALNLTPEAQCSENRPWPWLENW